MADSVHQRRVCEPIDEAPPAKRFRGMGSSKNATCENQRAIREFPLDELPLHVLSNIAHQLTFEDLRSFRAVSRKTSEAVDQERTWTREISIEELNRRSPQGFSCCPPDNVGLYQVEKPLKQLLRRTPPEAIVSVNLNGVRQITSDAFERIFTATNVQSLPNVGQLQVRDCVLRQEELECFARYLPNVWLVELSEEKVAVDDLCPPTPKEEARLRRILRRYTCAKSKHTATAKARQKLIATLVRIYPKLEHVRIY